MKEHLKIISTFLLGALICLIGLTVISFLTGCSPRINMPDIQVPEITTQRDTVVQVKTETKTDTVELAGYVLEIHDTIPCPAGLEKDSNVLVTITKYLPGQKIITTNTVHDTVRLVSALPAPGVLPAAGAGWTERLTWLGSVILLLAALWKKWKKEQSPNNSAQ